jgi:release factor glutamine methyltransferase
VIIQQRVAKGRETLRAAGLAPAGADLDARLLAEHLLGWDTARFFTSADQPEPADFAARYEPLVARRAEREPLAYITGRREFWHLEFDVSPAVLIPRPETELLVEAALELFPSAADDILVADVGTGSGCLAVAIARERPHANIVATDISAAALDVARQNAARHGVADRIRFVQADLFEDEGPDPLLADLIVANPPYVAERDRPGLQPEVRDHEPAVALFGGASGLDALTRLIAKAPGRLKRGGWLAFEFGFGQEIEVEHLLSEAADLAMVGLRRDLQGLARVALARRS